MKFKVNGKAYRWRPEVMFLNMGVMVGAIACTSVIGLLAAYWFVSLL